MATLASAATQGGTSPFEWIRHITIAEDDYSFEDDDDDDDDDDEHSTRTPSASALLLRLNQQVSNNSTAAKEASDVIINLFIAMLIEQNTSNTLQRNPNNIRGKGTFCAHALLLSNMPLLISTQSMLLCLNKVLEHLPPLAAPPSDANIEHITGPPGMPALVDRGKRLNYVEITSAWATDFCATAEKRKGILHQKEFGSLFRRLFMHDVFDLDMYGEWSAVVGDTQLDVTPWTNIDEVLEKRSRIVRTARRNHRKRSMEMNRRAIKMQPQYGAGNPLAEYYRRTQDQTSGGRGSEWGIQPKCCLNNCAQIEETHKPHQLRCLQCGWGHWCSLVCYALDNTRYNDGCFNRSSGAHPLHCSGTDPVQKEQNLSAVDELMNPSSKKRCCDCCGKVTPLDGEEEGEKKKKFQTCVSLLFVCCTTTTTYFCSFGF